MPSMERTSGGLSSVSSTYRCRERPPRYRRRSAVSCSSTSPSRYGEGARAHLPFVASESYASLVHWKRTAVAQDGARGRVAVGIENARLYDLRCRRPRVEVGDRGREVRVCEGRSRQS